MREFGLELRSFELELRRFAQRAPASGCKEEQHARTQRRRPAWAARYFREDDGDGLELGDDQHGILIGGVYDVALVDEAKTDASGDGGGNVAISDLELGVVNGGLVRPNRAFELNRRRLLRVHLLLRHGTGYLQQIFEALIVELRVTE